jgi:hypothetical protein
MAVRSGHQRFTGAGRADHQHPARSHGTSGTVFLRVLEEIDDLGDLLFGTFVAGKLDEAGGGTVVEVVHAGLGAAHPGNPTC